jgi:hypothetical protein
MFAAAKAVMASEGGQVAENGIVKNEHVGSQQRNPQFARGIGPYGHRDNIGRGRGNSRPQDYFPHRKDDLDKPPISRICQPVRPQTSPRNTAAIGAGLCPRRLLVPFMMEGIRWTFLSEKCTLIKKIKRGKREWRSA